MKTVADILRRRIEELGYSDIKECAREHDLPYELLRKVISSGHLPKDSTLLLYAERLGLDAEELISTTYRQRAPQTMKHMFSARPVPKPTPAGTQRLAPVLGRAACGEWLENYTAEPDLYEPVDVNDPEAFFVKTEGDSMVGGNIPPGAYLLISPSASVSNGQIVLARRGDEEVTVKTYFRRADGTTILQPMNPSYEPLIVDPGDPLNVMRVTEIRIKL